MWRWASYPLVILVAVSAILGIAAPSIYARETISWAAQGIGQDWMNLVFVTPLLAITGWLAPRSRAARLVFGGTLAYIAYSFMMYATSVHFNALFLVYIAILGLSVFALVELGFDLARERPREWYDARLPRRSGGIVLIVLACSFAGLWLATDIPALIAHHPPAELAEIGLPSNPVHVLDLGLVLPAMALAGLSLYRRRALGYLLAPLALAFAVVMATVLAGMTLAIGLAGAAIAWTPCVAMAIVGVVSGVTLRAILRTLRR